MSRTNWSARAALISFSRLYPTTPDLLSALQVFVPSSSDDDTPKLTFTGKWNTELVCPELDSKVIFKAPTVSQDRVEEQYGFSPFACQLNALPADGTKSKQCLAPTDSRLRPDQRMHEGDVAGADEKKIELEQAQRDRRGDVEAKWNPR
jgi:hypothetical protein